MVVPKIASPDPSTMADSRRPVASAALRSVMSIDEPITATNSPSLAEHGRVGDEHVDATAVAKRHFVVARPIATLRHQLAHRSPRGPASSARR